MSYELLQNSYANFGRSNSEQTEARAANSSYKKFAAQWVNGALCFYQSFCLVDSEVLRNPPLRQAANH